MSVTEQLPPKAPTTGRGGRRRPPRTPKGRQIDPQALVEVRALLTDRSRRRDLLIEHLHLIQDQYGYLSAPHLAALAAEMKMALTEVYEVATFYAHFDVVKEGELPPPPVTVRVCDSLSCAMAGAEKLIKELSSKLGREVRVVHAPCMGACDRAPVCAIGHVQTFNATPETVAVAVKAKPHAHAWKPGADFAAYQKAGGYALLRACITDKRTRDELIKIVSDSGLRGLGGAGFPTGRKWSLVRAEPAPRMFAINADEGMAANVGIGVGIILFVLELMFAGGSFFNVLFWIFTGRFVGAGIGRRRSVVGYLVLGRRSRRSSDALRFRRRGGRGARCGGGIRWRRSRG